MSTILDALRKLQGDREGMAPPPRRDLRSSVLDTGPLPPVRAPRQEPKGRPLFAAAVGGAVVAASVAGVFAFWGGDERDSFGADPSAFETSPDATLMAQAEVPPMPAPEPQPPPRAPEPLVNLAAPPEPPPEGPEARYAAFQPPPPQPDSTGQPLFQPQETFAPVNARARLRMEDEAHGEITTTYVPQQYEAPQIVTREPSQRRTRPAELENAMDRARERLARSNAPAPARPRRERREEPPPPEPERPAVEERIENVPTGIDFPDVQVQSVLWHPDPLRRQATILLDGQLATDAREGDLIGGVLIDRITPGSVEFRMGQERKRVDMTP